MSKKSVPRRYFLKTAGLATSGIWFATRDLPSAPAQSTLSPQTNRGLDSAPADYRLRIAVSPVEIAHNKFLPLTNYNGQFPGPLLRFKEGKRVTVEIQNDTDTPEQLHWHGQLVGADVDGAAEEGTPYIPAHGKRRITFSPEPSGLRFYHTHVRAAANLSLGQYGGEVGPVFIEGANEPAL